MTLPALSDLARIIGSIGVLFSLVLVAMNQEPMK